MSKFSVKKPLTVFVAVVAILVLGVVAYLKMTPDLLPNMDFPYVVIMTTDPGASPEKVENDVTKPLEQSMSTLEHIKEISSSSAENYSMLIMEFEDGVNLDTVGVDIQQKISALSASWDDTVGTPMVLKINPSMLPVEIAAVSMDGMNTIELTDFLDETLMNKLEGISGVARISTSGMIRQEIHVILDQKKIDATNRRIQDAIDKKMNEAYAVLDEKKEELQNTHTELSEARAEMVTQLRQLRSAKAQLDPVLEAAAPTKERWDSLKEERAEVQSELDELNKSAEGASGLGTLRARLQQTLSGTRLRLQSIDAQMELIRRTAEAQGASMEDIETLFEKSAELNKAIYMLEDGIRQIDDGMMQIEDAEKMLDQQRGMDLDQLAAMAMMAEGNGDAASMDLEALMQSYDMSGGSASQAMTETDVGSFLSIPMLTQILTAQNFSMPAGYVKQDGVSYMVSVGDEIRDFETVSDMLLFDLGIEGMEPIRLSDVAEVMITDNSGETYAKLNGADGIVLSFEKQSTHATAEVSANIAARFDALEAEYPGLSFVALMDQGDYIHLIIDTILDSLLTGAILAVLILLLFLKDWRPTLITLVSIPISVIFAIVLMYFSGVTINMISLSGLAVAVGMLVDNSVVVIENIYRLRANGANPIQAAVSGAKQVAGAVAASTLTTVCVFLPIVFVQGLTRQLFTDLALTMTYSLMASLIIALTLVPAMASGMLKKEKPHKAGLFDKLMKLYHRSVSWTLRHKAIVLILAVALLIVSGRTILDKGFSFMPKIDMPNISATITMPEGATMEEAVAYADEALARIATVDGIETTGALMSSGVSSLLGGGGSGEASYNVTVYITLADQKASGEAVGKQIEELCADMDCKVSATSAMMDMSMLTGSGISVRIYANTIDELQDAARQATAVLKNVEGVENVSDGLEDASPALHVHIDKDKAMQKGLTVAQVYMALAQGMQNSTVSTAISLEGISTDVIVELPEEDQMSRNDLRSFVIKSTGMDGSAVEVKLSDIASIEQTTSLSTIQRFSQRRYLTVSGMIPDDYNVTKVTAEAKKAMAAEKFGTGVSFEFGGENETIMEAIEQLFLMLLLGILLVYLVMVAQFQSLLSPFIVMFTIPLAYTGGFLALMAFNMDLSVISLIGFILLTGIIVNNGIVLVDYINQLRQGGMERRAAIAEAGVTRMRPILMTSITTILGLVDMAFGKNVGTALMQPVALVCIGGLLYATLMTLYVVPCMYDILSRKELRKVDEKDLKTLDI